MLKLFKNLLAVSRYLKLKLLSSRLEFPVNTPKLDQVGLNQANCLTDDASYIASWFPSFAVKANTIFDNLVSDS